MSFHLYYHYSKHNRSARWQGRTKKSPVDCPVDCPHGYPEQECGTCTRAAERSRQYRPQTKEKAHG